MEHSCVPGDFCDPSCTQDADEPVYRTRLTSTRNSGGHYKLFYLACLTSGIFRGLTCKVLWKFIKDCLNYDHFSSAQRGSHQRPVHRTGRVCKLWVNSYKMYAVSFSKIFIFLRHWSKIDPFAFSVDLQSVWVKILRKSGPTMVMHFT
jgi:hypothetical protein